MSEWVSEWVSDKQSQWSDSGPIKICNWNDWKIKWKGGGCSNLEGVWELVYVHNLIMYFVLFIEKDVWELGYENNSKDGFCCYF